MRPASKNSSSKWTSHSQAEPNLHEKRYSENTLDSEGHRLTNDGKAAKNKAEHVGATYGGNGRQETC